jgi:hypothetical protein
MADVEFEIPGVVAVSWDESCASVYAEWQGGATSAEFDSLLVAELSALKAHHASRLLADCRRQGPLDQEVQDRADGFWLPKAITAGLKRFAVVLPDNRDAAVNLEDRLGKVSRDTLAVGFFHDIETAKRWLTA